MPNVFDDFLEELRRRQAEQERLARGETGAKGASDPSDGPEAHADDRSSTEGSKEDKPVSSNGDDSDNGADRDDDQGVFRGGGSCPSSTSVAAG